MKKILYLLLLIPVLYSCTASDKCTRIEKRIARLYQKCPELVKSDSTTSKDSSETISMDSSMIDKINEDSIDKVFNGYVDKIDSLIEKSKHITNTDSLKKVIKDIGAENSQLKKSVASLKKELKDKGIDKTKYINRVITYTITNTIKKPYPVLTKPTFLEILGLTWWWLLIAFGLGMIVNGFKK